MKCDQNRICSLCVDNAALSAIDNTVCTCNSGYYLSYDTNTDIGTCTLCNPVCLTCTGPNSTDCTTCATGYTMSADSICVS